MYFVYFFYTTTEATPTYIPFTQNMVIFKYHFYCTGQEMNMTDCPLSYNPADDIVCATGSVAGVECGIGMTSPVTATLYNIIILYM